jgi:hypothetical protein
MASFGNRRWSLGCALLFGLGIPATSYFQPPKPPAPLPKAVLERQAASFKKKFDEIKWNMTRDQVQIILGPPNRMYRPERPIDGVYFAIWQEGEATILIIFSLDHKARSKFFRLRESDPGVWVSP